MAQQVGTHRIADQNATVVSAQSGLPLPLRPAVNTFGGDRTPQTPRARERRFGLILAAHDVGPESHQHACPARHVGSPGKMLDRSRRIHRYGLGGDMQILGMQGSSFSTIGLGRIRAGVGRNRAQSGRKSSGQSWPRIDNVWAENQSWHDNLPPMHPVGGWGVGSNTKVGKSLRRGGTPSCSAGFDG